jgi:TolB-like protein
LLRKLLAALMTSATMASPAAALADDEPLVVTVMYFENNSGNAAYDPLGKGFADMMITELLGGHLQIVERDRFEDVLKELKLQRTEFFDPATTVKIGRGIGAAYALTGSFLKIDVNIRIDARLIEVATASVVMADSVAGKPEDLGGLAKALAGRFRSRLEPAGAPSTKPTPAVTLKTVLEYSNALDLIDRGDDKNAGVKLNQVLAAAPTFQLAKDRYAEVLKRIGQAREQRNRIQRQERERMIARGVMQSFARYGPAFAVCNASAARGSGPLEALPFPRSLKLREMSYQSALAALKPSHRETALELIEFALEQGLDSYKNMMFRAELLWDLGRGAEALPALQQWLSANPKNDDYDQVERLALRALGKPSAPRVPTQPKHPTTCDGLSGEILREALEAGDDKAAPGGSQTIPWMWDKLTLLRGYLPPRRTDGLDKLTHEAAPPATFTGFIEDCPSFGRFTTKPRSGITKGETLPWSDVCFEERATLPKWGLWVNTLTPEVAKRLGAPVETHGVIVTKIEPDSPGAKAGIRLGDVINRVEPENAFKYRIHNVRDLRRVLTDWRVSGLGLGHIRQTENGPRVIAIGIEDDCRGVRGCNFYAPFDDELERYSRPHWR